MRRSTESLNKMTEEADDDEKLDKASSGHSSGAKLLYFDNSDLGSNKSKSSDKLSKIEEMIETPKVVADVPKYTAYYAPNYKCLTANDLARLHQSKVPIPENEAERIFALRQTELLDSDRDDPMFDRFTALAQRLFDVPIALVSLVDIKRQWFKSAVGLEAPETHRDAAFCAYTVLPDSPDVLVVEDAALDGRFKDNVLVTGPPFIRFYAGAALIVDDVRLGSLCIIDTVPHPGFTTKERMNILDLGVAVSQLIKDRKDIAINSSKQSATMILDMLTSISLPLLSVNEATQTLLQQTTTNDLLSSDNLNAHLLNTNEIDGEGNGKNGTGNGSDSSIKTPKKPENPKPSGSRSRRGSTEPISSAMMTKRELQHGLGRLNVLMECSLCFGKIMKTRAEIPFRYAGFYMNNVLTTVTKAQNILKQLTSGTHPDSSSQVVWDVGMKSIKGAVRHLCPPHVLLFTIVSGVEMLIDDWRKIHITLKFKEIEDVEYDALVQYLEKYNMEEENNEESNGQWRQGLYLVEFRVFDKIPTSLHQLQNGNVSSTKKNKDLGSGSNGSSRPGSVSPNGSSTPIPSHPRHDLFDRKLKTLEQVLIDSDGGMTNELSTLPLGGGVTPPVKHTLSGKREEGLLECWVPFAIYKPEVEMLDTVAEEDDDDIVVGANGGSGGSDNTNNRNVAGSRTTNNTDKIDNNNNGGATVGQGGVAATTAAATAATTAATTTIIKTKEGVGKEGNVAAAPSSGSGASGGDGNNEKAGQTKDSSVVPGAISSSIITTITTPRGTTTLPSFHITKKVIRLLFVDDSTTVQRLMSKWLKSVGCLVTLASNGKIALNLLKTKEFDICFMDFLMPVMSGIDAIEKFHEWRMNKEIITDKEISHQHHNQNMLMVGFSETSTVATLTHVFTHGCHFFCRKPPETHILSTIIAAKKEAPNLQEAFNNIRHQSNIRGCDGVIGVGYNANDIAKALGDTTSTQVTTHTNDSSSVLVKGGGKDSDKDTARTDGGFSTIAVEKNELILPQKQRNDSIKKNHSDLEFHTVQAQAEARAATLQKSSYHSSNREHSTEETSENSANILRPPMYLKATSGEGGLTGWKMFSSLTSPFGRSSK